MLSKIASLYEVTTDYLIDGKDIAKRLEQFKEDLTHQDGLLFSGEPMSEEALESLMDAMEFAFRQTQKINKKYTPKKYRKDDNVD
jgi:hypothetical protein